MITIHSIEELKKLGFKGIDADLETSIFEYGLCWLDRDDDYLFYHKIETGFDWSTINKNIHFWEEFDWVDKEQFLSFIGVTEKNFNIMPLPYAISDLLNYYGYQNVFGSSYCEGFEIVQ